MISPNDRIDAVLPPFSKSERGGKIGGNTLFYESPPFSQPVGFQFFTLFGERKRGAFSKSQFANAYDFWQIFGHHS